jgi:hypothetical protein
MRSADPLRTAHLAVHEGEVWRGACLSFGIHGLSAAISERTVKGVLQKIFPSQ